jgi:uncharacterized membrane protein YqjE
VPQVQETTDQSVSELVQRASNQAAELVRDEIKLAQLELQEKGKRAGIGVGMFGGSGLFALFGLGALVAAAVMALATAVDAWLAGLIVAVVLFAVAGVLALTGKKQVEQATPPAPEQAIDSVKTDVDQIKRRASR